MSKRNFAPLFCEASQDIKPEEIICGLYTFQPGRINYEKCISRGQEIDTFVSTNGKQNLCKNDYVTIHKIIDAELSIETVRLFEDIFKQL